MFFNQLHLIDLMVTGNLTELYKYHTLKTRDLLKLLRLLFKLLNAF